MADNCEVQENNPQDVVIAAAATSLTEEPRLFFAHFWGRDDAVKLARGLRSALDQMNIKHEGS